MPESANSISSAAWKKLTTAVMVIAVLVGLYGLGSLSLDWKTPIVAGRIQCQNNLKQIALAMLNYESDYHCYPPAYTVDSEGNMLHSWRTLILPYIGESSLYSEIDLTKPWNDATNAELTSRMPGVYKCPLSSLKPGQTTYLTIRDPLTLFNGPSGTTISQITDGTAHTLLVIEAPKEYAVNWMQPTDLEMPTLLRITPAVQTVHHGTIVVFADAQTTTLEDNFTPETLKAIATISGGEEIAQ